MLHYTGSRRYDHIQRLVYLTVCDFVLNYLQLISYNL